MADIFRKGSKGDAVVAIQEKLQHLGFALEADGHFGDITHNIVVALQVIFGYDMDGTVGPATLKLIEKQVSLNWNLQRAQQHGYPTHGASA